MGKIYSYAEYLPIAKVGDVVKEADRIGFRCDAFLTGKHRKVIEVSMRGFKLEGCPTRHNETNCYLEIVSSPARIPTWETLAVGDEVRDRDGIKRKVLAINGDLFAFSFPDSHIYASWKVKQDARENGWSLVTPPVEPEVQEMTVEEVSKLVGKKVKIVE